MQKSTLGIEHVKEMVIAVIDLGNAAGRAYEDGDLGIDDIDDLWQAAGAVRKLVRINFKGYVFPELKDLGDDEFQAIVDVVTENFDIPQDEVEDRVEAAMGIAHRQFAVLQEAVHWWRNDAVG